MRETYWATRGIVESLAPDRWLNSPYALEKAENKVVQLSEARRAGLSIPETLVSSNPVDIRGFAATNGPCVVKPLRSGYLVDADGPQAMYTTTLDEELLDSLDQAQPIPLIVQEQIQRAAEIRVTGVAGSIFGAQTVVASGGPLDWRAALEEDLEIQRHDVPLGLSEALLRMARALHLEYFAADFILTPDGRYFFLELNPGGQWLWIEDATGHPISHSIARYLDGEGA